MRWFMITFVAIVASAACCCKAEIPKPIAWQDWSDDVFKQAATQHKFVLLDLQATWCHWCHVMDAQTYSDPQVIALIAANYIPIRVDADSRPDLANRYEDYGWPATVVFNSDRGEIVKRRGFLNPTMMASMLRTIVADPTPGPSVLPDAKIEYAASAKLTDDLRQQLLQRHQERYDPAQGGWGHDQKFLDPDSVQWSMEYGDEHMARQTLDGQLNLLDPAWGGVYQYSAGDDWKHPHFEKIMQMQAGNLRLYSLAYARWHDPAYLHAAEEIHRFLVSFMLGPNGAFYTSQDADLIDGVHSADYFSLSDEMRRKQGIPRIDKHQYSRENGWAITSLTALYQATGDSTALQQAIAAATWIIDHRSLPAAGPGLGFSHNEHDLAGPYLGDTLAMGQAFLELYCATADRAWLTRSEQTADFMAAHFVRDGMAGVMTADVQVTGAFAAKQEIDENSAAARWANLLSRYSGRKSDQDLAAVAMRYLATPAIAMAHGVFASRALLADRELSSTPLHITIVASKTDPAVQQLFHQALAAPTSYKRVEWYDRAQGPLSNMDVEYPALPKPAAFVCDGDACSSPAYTPDQLKQRITKAQAAGLGR